MDRLSHRYSKATPPIEHQAPLNPLVMNLPDVYSFLATAMKPAAESVSPGPTSNPPTIKSSPSLELVKELNISCLLGCPWQPLTLTSENVLDFSVLSSIEQHACIVLRIKPKAYLCIKGTLLNASLRNGGVLKKKQAREMLKVSACPGIFS